MLSPSTTSNPHARRSIAAAIIGLIAAFPVTAPAALDTGTTVSGSSTETTVETPRREVDTTPTLYVTATAHLDTQWLWTIQQTIDEYIPDTLRGNFAHFEAFDGYHFSFEGAFRYMLAKEYYPEDYARLKQYIADGKWHVCGSSVDAGDVNIPAPESLIRHVLYGNGFFDREFGKKSVDIYLPDCFGFGYALPSVAAHCGLKGFSTQKLTWGSSIGIPFNVGFWEGVDGTGVIAALNPGEYVAKLRSDLSHDEDWLKRITATGEKSGAFVDYKYFGVGDVGGAPDDESIDWLKKSIAGDGPVKVRSAAADQLYRDLTPEQVAKLPRYKGEMLMTRHGTGCYTSQTAMKRWNRKNELLADATERAAVAADWLGGTPYPKTLLRDAWVRFLWHQFHDDLTGTSIPQAYPFSWNDEIIALNQFAGTLTDGVGAVARAMDTTADGVPLVVFNPLAFEREDVVTARVRFDGDSPAAVRVFDGAGREVVSQIGLVDKNEVEVTFLASAPSVGFAVFDVRPSEAPCDIANDLSATANSLENGRYRVRLDENGDVASLFDKHADKELLAGPIRLQLLHDKPDNWSEWEVQYRDIVAEPYAHVAGPVEATLVESGPARATIEVKRSAQGSSFVQRISLGADGDRLVFDNVVDWRTRTTLLKAVFPLTAANDTATYDLGFGVIERPNNTEKIYEVPAQQWADLTHRDGSFGAAILNDCKYGWDKPADNTLRLTLIHLPNDVLKDLGRHRFTYAVAGHKDDWRSGGSVRSAARLNQPLMAFQTNAHAGRLGRRFSLVTVDSPQVVVRAIKQAEDGKELIVRVQEAHGSPVKQAQLGFAGAISSAREVNGQEEPVGDVSTEGPRLGFDLKPFQPRTFAVQLATAPTVLTRPSARPVDLPFDVDVVSTDDGRTDGDFDGSGHSLPGELLPERLVSGGIPFRLSASGPGMKNAVACRGQSVALPPGDFNRLYLLAAANGTTQGDFIVGSKAVPVTVRDFGGWIGQADSLVDEGRLLDADSMAPAFIHRDRVAWVGTHRHDAAADRNEPYIFCYLFRYAVDLPPNASTVTLPDNEKMRVFAMTAADNSNDWTTPAQPLYDEIEATHITPSGGLWIDPVTVALSTDAADAQIVYTLDGSEPKAGSTKYEGPFELTRSTTISARSIHDGRLESFVNRATFTFATPRTAATGTTGQPGLAFRYFEGEWRKIPDFSKLTPALTGHTDVVDISPKQRDEYFGFEFTGYVEVPSTGIYTFHTESDDGSRLYIGDALVVDNDGLHGMREGVGRIALAAGRHPIRVTYFERTGGDDLVVSYEGPGVRKQPIPAGALTKGN